MLKEVLLQGVGEVILQGVGVAQRSITPQYYTHIQHVHDNIQLTACNICIQQYKHVSVTSYIVHLILILEVNKRSAWGKKNACTECILYILFSEHQCKSVGRMNPVCQALFNYSNRAYT